MRNIGLLFIILVGCIVAGCSQDNMDPELYDEFGQKIEVTDSLKNGEDVGSLVCGDVSPVIVKINIQDKEGHNLLDPESEGNIVGSNLVKVEYNGKTYETQWNWKYDETPESRHYFAKFRGLLHFYTPSMESKPSEWVIWLGEIDGALSFDDKMKLTVGDKSYDIRICHTIEFGENAKYDKNASYHRTLKVYQDGKLIVSTEAEGNNLENPHLTLVM